MSSKSKVEVKEKNQNIHVALRCRPLNSIERKQGSCSVLSCDQSKKEVIVKERAGIHPFTKTYNFDHVFPPDSMQIDIYKSVVKPVVDEVLQGYNCTIFAYGQTGTGKTFTMEGERSDDNSLSWEQDPLTGLIPRALHQVFNHLEKQADIEFSVRVSFLELYNEELFDLLGSTTDPLRLRIYEDNMKKGSVIISGLEEVVVRTKNEVYDILQKGTAKRQTAATLMNAVSSRSHSVFSVTIHIKENNVEGEELLKTGKLYLVDLAGSENIGRSGAVEKRAREAGNINQSLLTLGRVITALVEHAPHVPYRESKLTRLLQDSLGGRTKTSIIATVSPASINLEETLSTLDYAFRAKNITNRPEINQKLTKKALLKEYNEEIERLRRDLQASRDKNGIYMAEENYIAMHNQISLQTDGMQEMQDKITAVTEELKNLSDLFTDTKEELAVTTERLESTIETLEVTTTNLKETKQQLKVTKQDRDENKYLVEEHVKNEDALYTEANQLLNTADSSVSDVTRLHDKVDRGKVVEEHNETAVEKFQNNVQNVTDSLTDKNSDFMAKSLSIKDQTCKHIDEMMIMQDKDLTQRLTSLQEYDQWLTKESDHQKYQITGFLDSSKNWAQMTQKEFIDCLTRSIQQICDLKQKISSKMLEMKTDNGKLVETLSEFRADIKQQADNLTELLTKQQSETISHCTELNQLTLQFAQEQFKQTATAKKSLQKAADEDKQFEKQIMDLLKKRSSGFHKVVSEVQTSYEDAESSTSALSANLSKQGERFSASHGSLAEEAQKYIADHVTSNYGIIQKVSDKCKDSISTSSVIECHLTDLNKEVFQHSDKTKENLSENITGLVSEMDTFHESYEQSRQTIQTESQRFTESCVQLNDDSCRLLKKDVNQIAQLVKEQAKAIYDTKMTLVADLSAQKTIIHTFVTEELQKNVPTGMTPQRLQFHYPRVLTKTDVHEHLLEEFRANRRESDPIVLDPSPALSEFKEEEAQISTNSIETVPSRKNSFDDVVSEASVQSMNSTSGVSTSSHRSKMSAQSCKENTPGRMRPPVSSVKVKKADKLPVKTSSKTHAKTKFPLRSNNP